MEQIVANADSLILLRRFQLTLRCEQIVQPMQRDNV